MGQDRRGRRVRWMGVLLRGLHGRPLVRFGFWCCIMGGWSTWEQLNIEECVFNGRTASYRYLMCRSITWRLLMLRVWISSGESPRLGFWAEVDSTPEFAPQ